MKKIFEVLKKYFVISFLLNVIILTWDIISMVRSNTLPTINSHYIIKVVFYTLIEIVTFIPGIAFIDWCIVRAAKVLIKDYKESDRKGRIIIIVIFISLLLRKILIWTS